MSIQPIVQSLDKLAKLHESLFEISMQKTEVIKKGEVEKLQSLLVKERRHVQALEQVENKRQEEVEAWFKLHESAHDNPTITGMLEVLENETEKQELAETTTSLTKAITKLKQQEQLNQALIQQSMQFVELSLDMMNPSIKNMNYGNKKGIDTTAKRSVFDSKA